MSEVERHVRSKAWTVTSLLLVLMLINFADKALLGLAAKDIMNETGLSPEQYGTISSVFFLLFSISALVGGVVSDRFPAKWLLIGMVLIWSVAQGILMLPLGILGFWVILASRALLGAAEGPAYPIANRTAHQFFPDRERDLPTGVLSVGGPLGVVIAAPLLAVVIAGFGWRSAFLLMAILGLVWALLWLRFGDEPTVRRTSTVSTHTDGAGLSANPERPPYYRVLVTRTWIGAVCAGLGAYWAQGLFVAWIPIYVSEVLGFEGVAMGLVVAIPWMLTIVMLVFQGLLIRRLVGRGWTGRATRGSVTSAGLVVSGVCIALTVIVDPTWIRIALLSIALSAVAVAVPIGQALCSAISPPQRSGGILGAYVGVCSMAAVVAPTVTGRIIAGAGSYVNGFDRVFTITAVIFVVGGVLAAILIDPDRDAQRISRQRNLGKSERGAVGGRPSNSSAVSSSPT